MSFINFIIPISFIIFERYGKKVILLLLSKLSLCLIHLSLLSYDFNIIDEKSKKKLKKYYNLLKGMKKIKFLQCNFILNIIISSRFNVNFGKIVN